MTDLGVSVGPTKQFMPCNLGGESMVVDFFNKSGSHWHDHNAKFYRTYFYKPTRKAPEKPEVF